MPRTFRRAFSNAIPGNGIVLAENNGQLTGVIASWQYSSLTAAADPGAGVVRFNHATIASATVAYIDNLDGQGNDLGAWLSAMNAGSQLIFKAANSPSAFVIVSIVSVVNSTGYRTVTFTVVAGSPTFLNGETLAVQAGGPAGATGATGPAGAGSGDVTKVGTPVNNQLGVWTGDGTLEGDASLTFDTTTDTLSVAASGKIAFGAVNILDDTAGTTTLSNIDALDATTEATIEAAIDTLANLISIQGRTVTLADAGADAIFGWDDSANAYINLSAADVRTAAGLVIGTNVQAYDADLTTWASITPSVNVQSFVSAADYSAMRTLLGLVIGTNVQAYDAELAAIAGLVSAADSVPYFTGSGTAALATVTAAARTVLDDTTVAAMATTLGLGTASSPQFTGIELGHATDTTITRVSAGVIAVEGVTIATLASPVFTGNPTAPTPAAGDADTSIATTAFVDDAQRRGRGINAQTGTTYTFVLTDAGKLITFSNAAAVTVTVPPNSSVAFTAGDVLNCIQKGAGQVAFAAGVGVTIRSSGSKLKLTGQYSAGSLVYEGTDVWYLFGDIAT
jgi:hypothetical protein